MDRNAVAKELIKLAKAITASLHKVTMKLVQEGGVSVMYIDGLEVTRFNVDSQIGKSIAKRYGIKWDKEE